MQLWFVTLTALKTFDTDRNQLFSPVQGYSSLASHNSVHSHHNPPAQFFKDIQRIMSVVIQFSKNIKFVNLSRYKSQKFSKSAKCWHAIYYKMSNVLKMIKARFVPHNQPTPGDATIAFSDFCTGRNGQLILHHFYSCTVAYDNNKLLIHDSTFPKKSRKKTQRKKRTGLCLRVVHSIMHSVQHYAQCTA